MLIHPYVMEKMMELDAERVAHVQRYQPHPRAPRDHGILRAVGRALRTAGEGLESWAAPNDAAAVRGDYSCPGLKHC